MATSVRGARVLSGDMRAALLDGDTDAYDMERGYTRHTINDAPDNPGILVRLATTSIINHLRLLLWDRDNRLVPPSLRDDLISLCERWVVRGTTKHYIRHMRTYCSI